jgi:hypothetical protein
MESWNADNSAQQPLTGRESLRRMTPKFDSHDELSAFETINIEQEIP